MKARTTTDLFEEVINIRGIHNQLEVSDDTIMNLRRNYKAGKVTLDRMHQILQKAGYRKTQETLWK